MATNWNGENTAPEPGTLYSRGYDVETGDIQANESGANAYLIDEGDKTQITLTIIAIETSLSLAGSEGQSQLQKDFYPKNFQQPSFTIVVQGRSQRDIGRAAEFVHKAQRNAVSQGSLMTLIVPSGGLANTRAPANLSHVGMKGIRRGMQMSGYVKSMPRAHKRHDPAPVYTFDFIVSRMLSGIFEDQPYKAYNLAKWSDIVDTVLSGNFINPPVSVEQEEQTEAIREAIDSIPWIGDALDF